MYIRNLKNNPELLKTCYFCNKYVHQYLQEHNIPVMGKLGRYFTYNKTDLLQEVLDNMPIGIKLLSKF